MLKERRRLEGEVGDRTGSAAIRPRRPPRRQAGRPGAARGAGERPQEERGRGPSAARLAQWDVSTWHSWLKRLNCADFFEKVTERPELLPAYTEQYKLEALRPEEREVIPRAARLLHELLPGAAAAAPRLADLGCGDTALARELRGLPWPGGRGPEVVSVDAAPLADGVEVHNIAALPAAWAGRFDAVVLCRALWGRDYHRALAEARRVLRPSSEAFVLVVEPFKRWWGRERHRPSENALLAALRRAGFVVDLTHSCDVTPRPVEEGSATLKGFFQYVVARPELSETVGAPASQAADSDLASSGLELR